MPRIIKSLGFGMACCTYWTSYAWLPFFDRFMPSRHAFRLYHSRLTPWTQCAVTEPADHSFILFRVSDTHWSRPSDRVSADGISVDVYLDGTTRSTSWSVATATGSVANVVEHRMSRIVVDDGDTTLEWTYDSTYEDMVPTSVHCSCRDILWGCDVYCAYRMRPLSAYPLAPTWASTGFGWPGGAGGDHCTTSNRTWTGSSIPDPSVLYSQAGMLVDGYMRHHLVPGPTSPFSSSESVEVPGTGGALMYGLLSCGFASGTVIHTNPGTGSEAIYTNFSYSFPSRHYGSPSHPYPLALVEAWYPFGGETSYSFELPDSHNSAIDAAANAADFSLAYSFCTAGTLTSLSF